MSPVLADWARVRQFSICSGSMGATSVACRWSSGRRLFDLLPADHPRLLYVDHVEGDGARFLQAAAAMDLEGVVGKYAAGTYQVGEDGTSWVKVCQSSARALFVVASAPRSKWEIVGLLDARDKKQHDFGDSE